MNIREENNICISLNLTVGSSFMLCSTGINGKVKSIVAVPMDCPKEQALEIAMADAKVIAAIGDKKVFKQIVVPNKIINLVVK